MSDETRQDAAAEAEKNVNEEGVTANSAEDTPLTLEEQLADALAQSAENLEGWQRARAEFTNARKRFDQQKIAARTNALVEIAEKLLPVIDDFDLAFANVPEEVRETDWFSGVELIPRKFTTILENLNIERIASVGEPFDPNIHNALMREASDKYQSDTVIKEYQAGFKIGDRIIRPALVVVAE
ncbi:MAG TPA: nucleotide exchange factor GrpE [Anaerolineae bacterium]|nr:nucleotide exchange factor GrpE [Anaerolineae bacterium]